MTVNPYQSPRGLEVRRAWAWLRKTLIVVLIVAGVISSADFAVIWWARQSNPYKSMSAIDMMKQMMK